MFWVSHQQTSCVTRRSGAALFRALCRRRDRRAYALAAAILICGCTPVQTGSSPVQQAFAPPVTPNTTKTSSLKPYSIHLLSDGTEMELAGGMPEGTADAVQNMLDAHPSIKVIHLNSDGGEMIEGYKLSLLIKQRHLTTYTAATCASACTLAFLGGSPRYLAQGAWLGFHSAARTLGGETWAAGNDALRTLYLQDGLPHAFVDKALQTIPSELWFPTAGELRAAHVIDAVVDNGRFAKSGLAYWASAADVDQALKENDLYAAISAHDTEAYTEIQSVYLSGAKHGGTIAAIDDQASQFVIGTLVPRYIKKASDQAVLRYQRVQVEQLTYLKDLDTGACAAQAFPNLAISQIDYMHELPLTMKREGIAALADIANSAFEQPHAPDSKPAAHAAMLRYIRLLYREAPDVFAVISEPAASRNDPAKLCHAATAFLKGILDQPSEDAAIIARDLMGGTS
ncbi:MAG TPA: hypothetical protein VM639_19150 [Dongiaceae bacterium]|nr:hypothetical protein [Dongiaceae bacterium]